MKFRLLGPLEVRRDGTALALGGPRQRAVLTALLMRANEIVTVDYLAVAAWQRPPASLLSNVRTYMASLCRLLTEPDTADSRLRTGSDGYQLEVRPGELDLAVFEDLAEAARRSGDPASAADLYRRALELWRGPLSAGWSRHRPGRAQR